jgi:hypothetical protein
LGTTAVFIVSSLSLLLLLLLLLRLLGLRLDT